MSTWIIQAYSFFFPCLNWFSFSTSFSSESVFHSIPNRPSLEIGIIILKRYRIIKGEKREFPSYPVVSIRLGSMFTAERLSSIPGWGTKIPEAAWCSQQQQQQQKGNRALKTVPRNPVILKTKKPSFREVSSLSHSTQLRGNWQNKTRKLVSRVTLHCLSR